MKQLDVDGRWQIDYIGAATDRKTRTTLRAAVAQSHQQIFRLENASCDPSQKMSPLQH